MEGKAKKLTRDILKPLNELDNPLACIIEEVMLKSLNDAYMKGYKDATDNHLKTIKNTFTNHKNKKK